MPFPNRVDDLKLAIWDIYLNFLNLISPSRKVGHVIPAGHPGFGGQWPVYIAPKEGDSRCSCPALNAMANHGIIPHDGKNVTFKELRTAVRATYNVSPTIAYFLSHFPAGALGRSYATDAFDLKEIDLHNDTAVEHDASFFRRDTYFEADQSKVHLPHAREFLDAATGKDDDGNPLLTVADMALISSKRRAESKAENPEYTLNELHRTFGNQNSGFLLLVFGGRVKDLEVFIIEERLADGWEPRVRKPQGLTAMVINKTAKAVENETNESKFAPARSET